MGFASPHSRGCYMHSTRQAAQATGHLASLAGPRAKSSPAALKQWLTLFLVPFCAAAPVKATESVTVWPPTCKPISGSKQLLNTCQHEARPNERSILWSRSRPSLQQALSILPRTRQRSQARSAVWVCGPQSRDVNRQEVKRTSFTSRLRLLAFVPNGSR